MEASVFSLDDVLAKMRENALHLPKYIQARYMPQLHSNNFSINKTIDAPMHYIHALGKIEINPCHHDFFAYDLIESLAHEIGHLIDANIIMSWKTPLFVNAV